MEAHRRGTKLKLGGGGIKGLFLTEEVNKRSESSSKAFRQRVFRKKTCTKARIHEMVLILGSLSKFRVGGIEFGS